MVDFMLPPAPEHDLLIDLDCLLIRSSTAFCPSVTVIGLDSERAMESIFVVPDCSCTRTRWSAAAAPAPPDDPVAPGSGETLAGAARSAHLTSRYVAVPCDQLVSSK